MGARQRRSDGTSAARPRRAVADLQLHKKIAKLFGYELIKTRKLNDTLEDHLRNVLGLHSINCVIDVGANEGQYGRLLRAIGYRGHIVSFEPPSKPFACLETASRGDPDWRIVPAALGARETRMKISRMATSAFSSFRAPSAYGITRFEKDMRVVAHEEVPITTLTQAWPAAVAGIDKPRVFLKLDTQGFDLDVLDGARDVLDEVLGIQAEISMKRSTRACPTI